METCDGRRDVARVLGASPRCRGARVRLGLAPLQLPYHGGPPTPIREVFTPRCRRCRPCRPHFFLSETLRPGSVSVVQTGHCAVGVAGRPRGFARGQMECRRRVLEVDLGRGGSVSPRVVARGHRSLRCPRRQHLDLAFGRGPSQAVASRGGGLDLPALCPSGGGQIEGRPQHSGVGGSQHGCGSGRSLVRGSGCGGVRLPRASSARCGRPRGCAGQGCHG